MQNQQNEAPRRCITNRIMFLYDAPTPSDFLKGSQLLQVYSRQISLRIFALRLFHRPQLLLELKLERVRRYADSNGKSWKRIAGHQHMVSRHLIRRWNSRHQLKLVFPREPLNGKLTNNLILSMKR